MNQAKVLVIIPTYNEIINVESITSDILRAKSDCHILFVDDSSPDGTAIKIKELQAKHPNIHLIERPAKLGLGTAYIAGFKFALKHDYQYIFEMDADWSHEPHEIPNFLNATKQADLVIGSRYIKGGRLENWPFMRLLLSSTANKYARIVTGIPVKDATGGFKCFKRKVLESIDLDRVRSEGYAFQIELNYRAWKSGFKLKEIPICFFDRTRGKSKMSKKIIWEAIWTVWRLRFKG